MCQVVIPRSKATENIKFVSFLEIILKVLRLSRLLHSYFPGGSLTGSYTPKLPRLHRSLTGVVDFVPSWAI